MTEITPIPKIQIEVGTVGYVDFSLPRNPDCMMILCRVLDVHIDKIEITAVAGDNTCLWISNKKIKGNKPKQVIIKLNTNLNKKGSSK